MGRQLHLGESWWGPRQGGGGGMMKRGQIPYIYIFFNFLTYLIN